jgi:uncharacterized protein YidB (DUF937 family)
LRVGTKGGNHGLDGVFNGMQNGPGGSRGLGGMGSGGGMSPITMALLGLLAYKAVKGFGGSAPAGSAPSVPGGGIFGGLGDLLKGGGAGSSMGGALGAGGLGGLLSGGLGDLLKQFQGAGKGDVAHSWVGTGQNQPITPSDLSKVLTPEQIDFLATRTGLSHEELLAGLSEQLPKAVDHLTPDGRLPTPEELNRAV